MRILAIADTRNRLFRRDGDEFGRQMLAFAKHWRAKGASVNTIAIDEKKNWKKHRLVLEAIEGCDGPVDAIAFFCHGWHNGISLGFTRYHIPELATALKNNRLFNQMEKITTVLYACSTFKKKTSFGPRLADATDGMNLSVVVGHSTKGHCTRNPFASRAAFGLMSPFKPCIRLSWWKRRKSPEWKAWVERLKGPDQYDFWE
jgi:hypothetical protein